MAVYVSEGSVGKLKVTVEYTQENLTKIKKIQGRRWQPDGKCWEVPFNQLTVNQLKSMFDCIETDIELHSLFERNIEFIKKPLHQQVTRKLDEELKLKGYSHKSIDSYIGHVTRFIDHYQKEPTKLTNQDIRNYLLYLLQERQRSHAYVNQVVSAIKFFYKHILNSSDLVVTVPRPKKENKLPEVLSKEEVENIFKAVTNLKHRALLLLTYSAGLRFQK